MEPSFHNRYKRKEAIMLSCLSAVRFRSCLECLDWVPVVSTASNLVHIFAKYGCQVRSGSSYGNYLHGKNLSEDLGLLVPVYNIYVKARKTQGYRLIPQSEIELSSIAFVQERRYPVSRITESGLRGNVSSYHTYAPTARFIEESEIETKAHYIRQSDEGVRFTSFNKAIIQQSSILSAFSACLQMLLVDKDEASKKEALFKNISSIEESLSEMTRLGFTGKLSVIPESIQRQPALFMETLKHYIFLRGPLIIGTSLDHLSSHFIIVDHVSDCLKFLRIRDPYHGWEITVKRKALIKKLKNKIVQLDFK